MKMNLKQVTVFPKTKIKNVLEKINKNGLNGVFVVNKRNILKGVITDSDIRRSLLKSELVLNKSADTISRTNYFSIPFSRRKLKKKFYLLLVKYYFQLLKKIN